MRYFIVWLTSSNGMLIMTSIKKEGFLNFRELGKDMKIEFPEAQSIMVKNFIEVSEDDFNEWIRE